MILLQLFCSVGMTAGYQELLEHEQEPLTSVFGINTPTPSESEILQLLQSWAVFLCFTQSFALGCSVFALRAIENTHKKMSKLQTQG